MPPNPVTFTDLQDVVPQRCFSAALSTVDVASVRIGIESGYNSATWQNKACIAATTAFNPRSVSDTFTVTVTAQPGSTSPASTTNKPAAGTSNGVRTGGRAALAS